MSWRDDLPPVRGKLLRDEPLGPYTWFRVGGAADALFIPADADDLADFLKALPEDVSVTVIGVGSNLIVRDGGVEGVVIRLAGRAWGQVTTEGDTVTAGAGALYCCLTVLPRSPRARRPARWSSTRSRGLALHH